MKFVSILILSFVIFSTFLNAEDIYIKLGTASSKQQLKSVKSTLNRMGYRMVYKVKNFRYIAYSGPYRSVKSSHYALRDIKPYFTNAQIIQTPKTKNSRRKTSSKELTATHSDNSGVFTTLRVGYSSAPSTHTIESGSVIINEPNSSGVSYSLEVGYLFKNSLSFSVNYMQLDASDLVFDNIYGSFDYRFNEFEDFTPFLGVSMGFSTLKWNIDPIDNATSDSNKDSSSILWGTSAGVIYPMAYSLFLSLSYQCMFMQHTTDIQDATNKSSLQHNSMHSLLIGLQYKF